MSIFLERKFEEMPANSQHEDEPWVGLTNKKEVVKDEKSNASDTVSAVHVTEVTRERTSHPLFHKLKQLLRAYRSALVHSPLKTKALTSCVISLLGEVLGAYLKRRKFFLEYKYANPEFAPRLLDVKRLAIFGFYGLAITGPLFHWWYGFLERMVRNNNINGAASVATKVVVDRVILTPPFLLFTLAYIQALLTLQPKEAVTNVKKAYGGALIANWKWWTIAQLVNFNYVPQEGRDLFGNLVAVFWNTYLSVINVQS